MNPTYRNWSRTAFSLMAFGSAATASISMPSGTCSPSINRWIRRLLLERGGPGTGSGGGGGGSIFFSRFETVFQIFERDI